MSGLRRAHVADLPSIAVDDPEQPDWTPVRHLLGIAAFGVNAWTAHEPGEIVIERHDETPGEGDPAGHEELYVVLEGEAEFVVGDERFRAAAGELVFVGDPALERVAHAVRTPVRVLAIGAAPGMPFTPSPWEQRGVAKLDA